MIKKLLLTLLLVFTTVNLAFAARDASIKNRFPLSHNGSNTVIGASSTESNIAWIAERFDGVTVAVFNGTSSGIVASSDFIATGADSLTAWIYPIDFGENSEGRIVDNGTALFYINDTNDTLTFSSDGSTTVDSATGSIVATTWTHVAVTRNSAGDVTNFYVNGVSSGTVNQDSGTPAAGTGNPIIGNKTDGSRTFNGYISDLRHYDVELTGDEVWVDFQSNIPELVPAVQPINTLPDLTDTSLVGAWLNKATVGAKDYTDVNDNGTPANIEAWEEVGAKFDGSDSIITLNNNGTGDDLTITAWIKLDSFGEGDQGYIVHEVGNTSFYLQLSSARLRWSTGASGTSSIVANQWIHAAVTVDDTGSAGTANFYVDGALSGTANQTVAQPGAGDAMLIGNEAGLTRTFDGIIKDVRVYNEVKTADFIQLKFEEGVPDSSLTLLLQDGTKDYSRYRRSLTGTSMQIVGSNMVFDGADSKLDTASNFISVGADTIMAWIYTEGSGENAAEHILDNAKAIFFWSDTNDRIEFQSDGSTTANSASSSVVINKWHHVAVTRTSAGAANFYVNGTLSGTADQSSGTPTDTGATNVFIGNNTGQSRTFDGFISDVRVFNEVKTAGFIDNYYDMTSKRFHKEQ